MIKEVIEVVNVVIINRNKKVLIAKRKLDKPMPDKWEFPGGKLEINETLKECGIREIKEELDLDIEIDLYLGTEELTYDAKIYNLHFYTAHKIDEMQELKLYEHTQSKWIDIEELDNYDAPAKNLATIQRLTNLL